MRFSKLLVLLFVINTSACVSVSGHGVKVKTVFDQDSKVIDSVCLLPAYVKGDGGLGFGPEAAGSSTVSSELRNIYILKPHTFKSRTNIVGNLLEGERKLITTFPVLVTAGDTISFVRLLVLKGGYKPVVLRQADVYHGFAIVLEEAASDEPGIDVSHFKDYRTHQSDLQALFEVKEEIVVDYTVEDMRFLESCIEK